MAGSSERRDGHNFPRMEFENSLQDIVAQELILQGKKPNENNMLAYKRKAEKIFPTFREDGSLVAGTEWHRVQDRAARLTYARLARRGKGK